MPPFNLPKLMAAYCLWEKNRRRGGRAVVSFQPATRRKPPAAAEVLVDEAAIPPLLQEKLITGEERWRKLINYCQTAPEPYPSVSFGKVLAELQGKLKPSDERLWLAFLQIANRVLTGEPQLLQRGSREVLAQDAFFRTKLYPPPPVIAAVTFRQMDRFYIAVVSAPNDHLVGRLFHETPAAAVISRDPQTQEVQVRVRVHAWRPPINLQRLRAALPTQEPWQLTKHANTLHCPQTAVTLPQLVNLLERTSSLWEGEGGLAS
jgi:hypothetical protein